MTDTITGGCRCSAVRYELALDRLPPIYCCHCLDCQSWSGSAFAEQGLVPENAIAATGPIIEYSYANRSGSTSAQFVCSTCHTRLWSVNARLPGHAFLRAGTLDGSDGLEPAAHIWVKRKQPWIVLPDQVPHFEENAPLAEFAAILMPGAGR